MDARVLGSSSLVEGLWHGPGDLPLFPFQPQSHLSKTDTGMVLLFGSDDPFPSHLWSLMFWAGPGAVGGALSKVRSCYLLSSSICLLIHYLLHTYYVLSPGENHEHGPGLPVCTLPTFLFCFSSRIHHVSRASRPDSAET